MERDIINLTAKLEELRATYVDDYKAEISKAKASVDKSLARIKELMDRAKAPPPPRPVLPAATVVKLPARIGALPPEQPFPDDYGQQLRRELLGHYQPKAAEAARVLVDEGSVGEMGSAAWQEGQAPKPTATPLPRPVPIKSPPPQPRPAAKSGGHAAREKPAAPDRDIGDDNLSEMFDQP